MSTEAKMTNGPNTSRVATAAGLLTATLFAVAASPASAASDPRGIWINDTGRGAVEIKDCGNKLCGHVVWVSSDKDKAKGCGRHLIGNVRKVGRNLWDKGWIYSPERKRRYDVELKPLSGDRLRVKGYAGIKMFSKTMIWKRAPDDLVRCDAAPSANEPIQAKTDSVPTNSAAEPTVEKRTAGVRETAPATRRERESVAKTEPATEPRRKAAVEPRNEPVNDDRDYDNRDTADNGRYEDDDNDNGGGGRLGNLNVDRFFTRDGSGRCKLDLPWVKVKFRCGDGDGRIDAGGIIERLKDRVGGGSSRNDNYDDEPETRSNLAPTDADNIPAPIRKPSTKVAELDRVNANDSSDNGKKKCRKYLAAANLTVTVPCKD